MDSSETVGRIHSIESLGAADGPGLRTVIFLQGCPLRCRYCHNPDSWTVDGGQLMTVADLSRRVMRFLPYYGEVGGVTLSGGEPLLQPDFTVALLEELKRAGISTALDTSGWLPDGDKPAGVPNEQLTDIIKLSDWVILDIKSPDPQQFQWLTGRPPVNLHRFLDACERDARQVWIRQVIVPGWNDQAADISALADFLDHWPRLPVARVQLLPYHAWGVAKWQKMGLPYPLPTAQAMSESDVKPLQLLVEQRLAHRLPGPA